MTERLSDKDSTWSAAALPRPEMVEVLERYLGELERGIAPDEGAVLAAHPELAGELGPYLESVRLLHGATRDWRCGRGASRTDGGDRSRAVPGNSCAGRNGRAGRTGGTAEGRQIGDYRIVREIGRGGMGIVYEAHQRSLNRRVAVKILPFAAVLDGRQIARFRNEAQAAAQLHHPHIVPVFAVGQEHGVYYYAMQYIDGQSLEQVIGELRRGVTEWGQRSTKAAGAADGSTTTAELEATGLVPSQRSMRPGDFFHTVARLGKQAAEALHHAHEYGIVHRDVKPSNLLIDHQGKLWVTDFGLARVQTGSGVTLTGDVVGTLRYMSPEQASGQAGLVDARTDVYSLGVTLYELVTQRHAFPGEDRHVLLRQIVNEEPVPPRRLEPSLPVDLETIVLGAMAKSRDERYASAQALADDLDRYLAGKPTLARRPTLADRAAKWARRHRALVAVAAWAMVVVSLVSAVGMVLLAREQARTSAALAQVEQSARTVSESFDRAERHFQQARGAVDQLGMRMADRLLDIPGAEELRRDLLAEALAYYRQFVAEAGDDPQLRHELAVAHFKSGVIAAKLGASSDAIAEYEAAEALLVELGFGEGAPAEAQAELAVTRNNLALLVAARGEARVARRHYVEAIAIQERLVEAHPEEPRFAGQLAESRANLGMLLEQLGDATGAEHSLGKAIDVLRALADGRSGAAKYARNLAIASNNLSYVLRQRDAIAAEDASREAVAILERLHDAHPNRARYQADLALCYNNLAALASQGDRVREAIDWYGRTITLQERLVRMSPAVVRHRSDLAISLNNLGVVYCRAYRTADADAVFARARELFVALADDYPDELAYRSSLAALWNNQALALAEAGRHEEALQLYPTAIASQRACWQELPESTLMQEVLNTMLYNYGQSLQRTGRLEEATEASLARRDLWPGEGERLFGVAVELAEIARLGHEAPGRGIPETVGRRLEDEIVATLRSVQEAGAGGVEVTVDERFAHLRGSERFASLVGELSGRPPEEIDERTGDVHGSSSTGN